MMKNLTRWMVPLLVIVMTGCDEEEKKKMMEMAERQLASQAEQNRTNAELQREVAKGSRELIEADAKSRQDIVTLHREVQQERAEFGKQRDALEEDRRDLASQRQWDSLTAASITSAGLLVCCVLPLVLCWYLLRSPPDTADDHQVLEVLLEDLVAERPMLLGPNLSAPALAYQKPEPTAALSDDSAKETE